MTWHLVMQWTCDFSDCGVVEYAEAQQARPRPPAGWTAVTMNRHFCDRHEVPVSGASPIGLALGLGMPGADPDET